MDYDRNIHLGIAFLLQGRVRKCGLLLIKFKVSNVTFRGHWFLIHRMRQSMAAVPDACDDLGALTVYDIILV